MCHGAGWSSEHSGAPLLSRAVISIMTNPQIKIYLQLTLRKFGVAMSVDEKIQKKIAFSQFPICDTWEVSSSWSWPSENMLQTCSKVTVFSKNFPGKFFEAWSKTEQGFTLEIPQHRPSFRFSSSEDSQFSKSTTGCWFFASEKYMTSSIGMIIPN